MKAITSSNIVGPKCITRGCKHFRDFECRVSKGRPRKFNVEDEGIYFVCDAFPDYPGIPNEIGWGDNLHTEPYTGDHGIQFEPLEKTDC